MGWTPSESAIRSPRVYQTTRECTSRRHLQEAPPTRYPNCSVRRRAEKRASNVIVAAAALLGASQASAGTLNKLIDGCENGYYVYQISWVGPWSESLIFMERKLVPSGTWNFYLGYLDTSGKYYPAEGGYWMRMMAQPSGGTAYLDSNILLLPKTACEIDP